METSIITNTAGLPQHMKRAAKVALAVGATVHVSSDGEQLLAHFADNDRYYFDPENVTLHALEVLGHARLYGFVVPALRDLTEFGEVGGVELTGWTRQHLIVRSVFSTGDVRIQIGASKWFQDFNQNTTIALRHALCLAFSSYYDEAIAPYTEA